MNITEETLCAVALSRIGRSNPADFLRLYNTLGSAKAVYDHRDNILDVIPDATPRLVKALQNLPDAMRTAEEEVRFDEAHGITPLAFNDEAYPERLRHCCDAPIVLFIEVRQISISVASSPS